MGSPAFAPDVHERRGRDGILVLLFVFAVTIPMVCLVTTWSRTRTRTENRPMAPWPTSVWSRDFPAAFDRAFSDRFGGREKLVWLHHASLWWAFGMSSVPTIMPGRDGWLYWLGEDGHSLDRHYRQTMPFSEAEVHDTVAELLRRQDWLAARGIAHVVVIVPEKFTIYPEYLPSWVAKAPTPTPYDRVRAAIARAGRVTFVDLRPALLAAKASERVYYQTDSHWNYNGAVVGYETMMEVARGLIPDKIRAIAPAVRPAYDPDTDVYSGDLAHMLALGSEIRERDVAPFAKVSANDASRCAHRIAGELFGDQVHVCDAASLPRAVVMCDSMALLMMPLLSENFSRTVYLRDRTFDRATIEREHPDIVIEELVERGLNEPGTHGTR